MTARQTRLATIKSAVILASTRADRMDSARVSTTKQYVPVQLVIMVRPKSSVENKTMRLSQGRSVPTTTIAPTTKRAYPNNAAIRVPNKTPATPMLTAMYKCIGHCACVVKDSLEMEYRDAMKSDADRAQTVLLVSHASIAIVLKLVRKFNADATLFAIRITAIMLRVDAWMDIEATH